MKEINKIIHGDNLDILKTFADNSIDSIVTDPPYGLVSITKRFGKPNSAPAKHGKDGSFTRLSKGFMGKEWDGSGIEYNVELWKECLRVLKPGGHLLSFAGTRTYHRITTAIEDAGFEIRDMISWIYGSGFPKSLAIGKQIDKMQGNEREVIGSKKGQGNIPNDRGNWGLKPNEDVILTKGNSEFEGWGTSLKPSNEPICVARKPIEGTVANNVLKYGTGGINIDATRIVLNGDKKVGGFGNGKIGFSGESAKGVEWVENTQGRFPANIIFDEQAAELLDEMSGESKSDKREKKIAGVKNGLSTLFKSGHKCIDTPNYSDKGGASRFFYCAKSSKAERNGGLEGFEEKSIEIQQPHNSKTLEERYELKSKNNHPTVKPLKLMQYLVRLVTPKGGVCLDPFAGSGTTLMACVMEGFNYIGIEREKEYVDIAEARIEYAKKQKEIELKQQNSQTNLFK